MSKRYFNNEDGNFNFPAFYALIAVTLIIAIAGYFCVSRIGDEYKEVERAAFKSRIAESASASASASAYASPSASEALPTAVPKSTADSSGASEVSLTQLYKDCCPSVVVITTYVDIDGVSTAYSGGSGFFITESGYIITNSHVLADISSAKIKTYSGDEYEAQIVGYDERTEVGLLKVNASEAFTAAKIGNSDELNVGEQAIAIGCPMGYEYSMTVGYISGLERVVDSGNYRYKMIQIDTAINSGNSGGPLFDSAGCVIGVTTLKEASNRTVVEGMGFAVPINVAYNIAEQLIKNGKVTRAAINATVGTKYDENYKAIGVYIAELTEGGAADKAGLKVGDIITALDGKTITTVNDMMEMLEAYAPGDTAEITYTRDSAEGKVTITFGSM